MVISVVGGLLLMWALGMFLYGRCAVKKNRISLVPRENDPRLAVLIPARDESKVIEG